MTDKMIMPANAVKKRITGGGAAYGTFVTLSEPALVEMIGYAGMDFALIDMEHSTNTTAQVVSMIRAAEVAQTTPVVRVTTNAPELILRAMDSGAGGVLVPQVNTAEQAMAAVRAARYAPCGERGLAGLVRAARYGFTPLPEYLRGSNAEKFVLTQVEHVEAVKNLDDILAVEGLDGIFIGPADLSQSMGRAGDFKSPELQRTIQAVIEKTRRTDKWAGIFCHDAEDANYWRSVGAQFLAIGADGVLFASALRNVMGSLTKN